MTSVGIFMLRLGSRHASLRFQPRFLYKSIRPFGLLLKRSSSLSAIGYVTLRTVSCADTVAPSTSFHLPSSSHHDRWWFVWCVRKLLRAVYLLLCFGPVLLAYPLICQSADSRRRWYAWLLSTVERSGSSAVIKIGQWSSTRRDVFSREFCDIFASLQRRLPPRPWSETEQVLVDNFGTAWTDVFSEFEREPIGSGCVAQVFRAKVDNNKLREVAPWFARYISADDVSSVAVKVVHPHVLRGIELDMSLLDTLANVAAFFSPTLRFIDPKKCMLQFKTAMERQVDMRLEAIALVRFRLNFANEPNVTFPDFYFCSTDILMESFEEGDSVNSLYKEVVGNGNHAPFNQLQTDLAISTPYGISETEIDTEKRRKTARLGLKALLKMIFKDNFVHGDLHPGNMMVRFRYRSIDENVEEFRRQRRRRIKDRVRRFFGLETESMQTADGVILEPQLIIYDAGITYEQGPRDFANFKSLFHEIIAGEPAMVAELLLTRAPDQQCKDVDKFKDEVTELVTRTKDSKVNLSQIKVSKVLSELLEIASRHRVALEPNFTGIVLSIIVLEGLGRSLDPKLDLLDCAAEFI